VALSDAGARYLERARRILSEVAEAEGPAQADRAEPSGRLVVAAPRVFGRLQVAPVVSAYLARHPAVVEKAFVELVAGTCDWEFEAA
jgi:DNA-binding transcriptional LysR family regulator